MESLAARLGLNRLDITDAQVHLWNHVAIPGREHRSIPLEAQELATEMASAGVKRAIVIPPSWGGDGNDLVKDAVKSHPDLFGAMGQIPVENPALRLAIEEWQPAHGLLGLRLLFNTPVSTRMLRDGALEWIWPMAAEKHVPLMILAHGSDDLLARIARNHPNLRIILDHLGATGVPAGRQFVERIETLVRLAEHENIAVKATALPLYSQVEYPHLDVLKQVRHVVDAFSPTRVFWGTDLSRLRCTYRQAVEMMANFRWRSTQEMESVMGNAIVDWLSWRVGSHA